MLRMLWDWLYISLAPKTDPYAVHDEATMEGYYTHIHSPSSTGNPYTLVIIFCIVKTAIDPSKRVLVYVLYAPGHSSPDSPNTSLKSGGFVREMYAPGWEVKQLHPSSGTGKVAEYTIEVAGIGSMEIKKDMQRWTVHLPAGEDDQPPMTLLVETTERTAWTTKHEISGPEGPFERLGTLLPLHWHVFSTASVAHWRLERDATSPAHLGSSSHIVKSGVGIAHIEKNHGTSFPTGWIWAHSVTSMAENPSTATSSHEEYPIRFAVAGGRIIGLEAYLVGFRDGKHHIAWDFTPPFAMGLRGLGLGMRTTRDWDRREVNLDVWDWGRWLHVQMRAPSDTFLGISGPLAKGFAPGLCQESFQAHFTITLRERRLNFLNPLSLFNFAEWEWRELARYEIEEAALEFGGDYVGEPLRNMKAHGES